MNRSASSADPAPASTRIAENILAELICRGVRDFVVCPGSRSQALALAAAEAERLDEARLHVRLDERSAAFFALGLARETGIPATLIVTSGTAVANLLPAALEAFHARVPMILLTADRPAELQGIRANQTVQRGEIFAGYTRWAADLPAPDVTETEDAAADARQRAASAFFAAIGDLSEAPAAGPVQLNIAFRDPLSGGTSRLAEEIARGPVDERAPAKQERTSELDVYRHGAAGDAPRAVVVAGADAGVEASEFALAAGIPLLAEPSSGARFGREAIQHWERLLATPELGGAIERVIVFGHPTLTRLVPALVQRSDVETVVVDPVGSTASIDRYDPGHNAAFARSAAIADGYDRAEAKSWLGAWVVADRALRAELTTMHEPDLEAARATGYKERNAYARAEVAAQREPITREHLTEAVWLATWPHDRLVVAASRLIRVLNRTAAPRNIRVHANRGLSGIDGTIATALGIAAASQSNPDPARAAGATRVLIGDLALLHDAGSLLLPPDNSAGSGPEPRPRIQLFVGNDGGGTIFDTLEAAQTARPEDFDRVMYTPQDADLVALSAAYGWAYERLETRGDLDRFLTAPVGAPTVVDVRLTR